MARVGGGAYMPPFGMCAARLCHPRARFLPALGMTVGVAENDMRVARVGAYVRGWRIHAAVWHVCGHCASRTMPSLHVVGRHHKATSAPPEGLCLVEPQRTADLEEWSAPQPIALGLPGG